MGMKSEERSTNIELRIRESVIKVLEKIFNDVEDHKIIVKVLERKRRNTIYVVGIVPSVFGRIEPPDNVDPWRYRERVVDEVVSLLVRRMEKWGDVDLVVCDYRGKDIFLIKVRN